MPTSAFVGRVTLAVLLATTIAVPPPGHTGIDPRQVRRPERPQSRRPSDPVPGLVQRIDRYLQDHEVDGVTRDARWVYNETEEIRQSVVCQLLAYAELQRTEPEPRLRADVVEHADFLVDRLDVVRSYTPFDGMLGYALLQAYEVTGEARFLQAGTTVVDQLLTIPTHQCVLNGGLMVAMATAQYALLTGHDVAAQKTTAILDLLGPYQNGDGSFPHWCSGSRDIHYTGWMGMELIHLERLTGDSRIPGWLASMSTFLEGRIGPDGRAIYEEPCPGVRNCTNYYYSRASGCAYDYDTRGWTVEPAYCALVFDHQGSSQYAAVMRFLLSLEETGTFPDLYGYWPPPEDPEYPWTNADTSVVNMSVIFWAMTTALGRRADLSLGEWPAGDHAHLPDSPRTLTTLSVGPNPARGPCVFRLTLAREGDASLAVHDAAGRLVRTLSHGWSPAGSRTLVWDGRDDAGRTLSAGIYFARLRTVDGNVVAKIALTE